MSKVKAISEGLHTITPKRTLDGASDAIMFWGDRLGALVDPWENHWTLAQRIKDMTPNE
jgi:hypothetical protein